MANKKSISQWTGAILAAVSLPLISAFSLAVGASLCKDQPVLGIIVGILLICVVTYVFAWLISKITYFIIK